MNLLKVAAAQKAQRDKDAIDASLEAAFGLTPEESERLFGKCAMGKRGGA